jgi:fucose 4-O-acetylase-like acetyltransferase
MSSTLTTQDTTASDTPARDPAAATREVAAAPGARDPWFDNAKMLLVTLVVLGHSWVLLPDNTVDNWLYDFLYLWHVPAFVLVTGYLSRSFRWTRRHLRRLVTTVAVPYVVFEASLATFRLLVGGEELEMLFADPHWPMWYLSVLFLWRLATPALTRLGAGRLLPAAVAASLLGGLTTGDVLDTARALGLLPFFVAGLLLRREHLALLRGRRARRLAVAVLGVAFAAAFFIDGGMQTEWLYWRSSYAELGTGVVAGMAIRLGLLATGLVLALSALALVPRREGWFTRLGAATLVVYLCHGFVVKGAEYAGFPAWAAEHPWRSLVLATLGSVAVALTLAAPPVARRLQPLVDPVGAVEKTRG